jgi:hypothetical protein
MNREQFLYFINPQTAEEELKWNLVYDLLKYFGTIIKQLFEDLS